MNTTTNAIPVGSVVIYHGSITTERGTTFRVEESFNDDRYTLRGYYPAAWADPQPELLPRLRNVRRESITPTGEYAVLCRCGHDVTQHNGSLACARGTCAACDSQLAQRQERR